MSKRFHKNIDGDFYTNGECLACGIPENQAPLLFAKLSKENHDTYFIKRPESAEELAQAISAANTCCTEAVRYAGTDKNIIRRLEPSVADHRITILGKVVPAEQPWWKLW